VVVVEFVYYTDVLALSRFGNRALAGRTAWKPGRGDLDDRLLLAETLRPAGPTASWLRVRRTDQKTDRKEELPRVL